MKCWQQRPNWDKLWKTTGNEEMERVIVGSSLDEFDINGKRHETLLGPLYQGIFEVMFNMGDSEVGIEMRWK